MSLRQSSINIVKITFYMIMISVKSEKNSGMVEQKQRNADKALGKVVKSTLEIFQCMRSII